MLGIGGGSPVAEEENLTLRPQARDEHERRGYPAKQIFQHSGGRSALNEGHGTDHAPSASHQIGTDDLVGAIVASLDQNRRRNGGDEVIGGVFVEQHDVVHAGERSQQEGPVAIGHDRPSGSLQPPHRSVGVDRHDETIAHRGRLLQVLGMTAVEDVEAAVGEHDPFTATALLGSDAVQNPPW